MAKAKPPKLNRRAVTWKPMLLARPRQNEAVEEEVFPDGSVSLTGTLGRPWWYRPPVTWVIPMRQTKKWALDALGFEVWRLCDGERRVEDIVDLFALAHSLRFHESRLLITHYIKSLIEKGLLAIEVE